MITPTPILDSGLETLLFTFGGGGICGYLAGKALRLLVKIAMVIVGAFILVLAFLSYKGLITANWSVIEANTMSAAFNASQQVLNMVHETATRFGTHTSLVHTEATPIAMTTGFIGGVYLGLRR